MARRGVRMGVRAAAALIALGSVAALAVDGLATTAADTMSSAREADLMNLLVQDCGSCHGLTMKGGLGSPLLPANLEDKDVEFLAEVILDGIPETPMPPWRGQLNEAEALWMARQLKKGIE